MTRKSDRTGCLTGEVLVQALSKNADGDGETVTTELLVPPSDPRRTLPLLEVLEAARKAAPEEMYAFRLSEMSRLSPATTVVILNRLQGHGWLVGAFEAGDPHLLGRPLRKMYSFTEYGRRQLDSKDWQPTWRKS